MVPRASAVVPGAADAEPIVIHADHVNVVKFASKEDNDYRTVSSHLRIMAQNAREIISSRWENDGFDSDELQQMPMQDQARDSDERAQLLLDKLSLMDHKCQTVERKLFNCLFVYRPGKSV